MRYLFACVLLSTFAILAPGTVLGDIIDFEGTGFAEGTVLSTLPGHPGVYFDTGILVLPGNPRFGFNGSSQGGPGGIGDANSGATYTAPDGMGETVSIWFDFAVSNLSFEAVDIEIGSQFEFLQSRVYDQPVGGNLLDSVLLNGGDPGTGDGLRTLVEFSGILGIRRLEFEGIVDSNSSIAGYAVDNISFAPVPEPSGAGVAILMACMFLGFRRGR